MQDDTTRLEQFDIHVPKDVRLIKKKPQQLKIKAKHLLYPTLISEIFL